MFKYADPAEFSVMALVSFFEAEIVADSLRERFALFCCQSLALILVLVSVTLLAQCLTLAFRAIGFGD